MAPKNWLSRGALVNNDDSGESGRANVWCPRGHRLGNGNREHEDGNAA
jgi:hypothetical protein